MLSDADTSTATAESGAPDGAVARAAMAEAHRRATLESLLLDRRISRAEMCRRADMCPVSVIHWIHRGDPGPTPKQARVVHKTRVTTANLAAALGVPVEAFGMGAAS